MKLSICMMVKNEEKNLRRCLESIKSVIDAGIAELIIVDTGSDDNSLEIAKEYTQNVYEHPWEDDFSKMRNISISYAKGEWIFIMDADEEIEEPDKMIKLFQKDLSKYNTINIKLKNHMNIPKDGEKLIYNISVLVRAFRNDDNFKYKGSIHEQPDFKTPIFSSDIVFNHYGYMWDDEELKKRKFERTTKLLKKELKKDSRNVYYQFQLAVSCSTIDKREGLKEMRKAYELIQKLSHDKKMSYLYVYGIYAKMACANNEYVETIKICKEGLIFSKDYIDLWYYLAIAYTKINDNDNTLNSFNEFLKCKQRFEETSISQNPAFTFYCLNDELEEVAFDSMAVVYIHKAEYNKALAYINKLKISERKSKLVANIGKEKYMQYVILDYLEEIKQNEDTLNRFLDILESVEFKFEDKQELINKFINFYNENDKTEEPYYLLNVVRECMEKDKSIDHSILNEVMKLNYDELGDYYGEIIYYIIKNNLDLSLFENMCDSNNLDRFTKYIIIKYEDINEEIINYLYKNEEKDDINSLRCWIVLSKNLLLNDKIDDNCYEEFFRKYVNKGIKYVHIIYNPIILKQDNIYDVSIGEHRFFLYLEKAEQIKEKNVKIYIQYLRKALKIFPIKKGIELLLEKVKKQEKEDKENCKNEFEEYKKMFKKNIDILLAAKKVNDAEALINEYLKIVPNDLEMLMLKSQLHVQYLN